MVGVVEFVQSCNQNAGTVIVSNIPNDIKEPFKERLNLAWDVDVKKLKDHGAYIINGIRSDIGGVYIKRTDCFEQLVELSEATIFLFIAGARECGKSGLKKESVHCHWI